MSLRLLAKFVAPVLVAAYTPRPVTESLANATSCTSPLPHDQIAFEAQLAAHLEAMARDPALRRVPRTEPAAARATKRPYQLGDFFLGKMAGNWTDGDSKLMASAYPESLVARYYHAASGPCDVKLLASLVPVQVLADTKAEVSTWCSVRA